MCVYVVRVCGRFLRRGRLALACAEPGPALCGAAAPGVVCACAPAYVVRVRVHTKHTNNTAVIARCNMYRQEVSGSWHSANGLWRWRRYSF